MDWCIISFDLMQFKQFYNVATTVSSRKKCYYFWWTTWQFSSNQGPQIQRSNPDDYAYSSYVPYFNKIKQIMIRIVCEILSGGCWLLQLYRGPFHKIFSILNIYVLYHWMWNAPSRPHMFQFGREIYAMIWMYIYGDKTFCIIIRCPIIS